MNKTRAQWIVHGLLAAIFLFVGSMKLIAPVEVLAAQFPMPAEFIRFIGFCEALGAFGLILPGLTRIHRELTPLAAAGLLIIMIGATVSTLTLGGGVLALPTVILGLLAASVAFSRREWLPSASASRAQAGA